MSHDYDSDRSAAEHAKDGVYTPKGVTTERHICSYCHGEYAPTKTGLVRGHWVWMVGPDGYGQYRCPGRGKPQR